MSRCCHIISVDSAVKDGTPFENEELLCPQEATIWIGKHHGDYFEVCGDCAPLFSMEDYYVVRLDNGRVLRSPTVVAKVHEFFAVRVKDGHVVSRTPPAAPPAAAGAGCGNALAPAQNPTSKALAQPGGKPAGNPASGPPWL